MLIVEAHDEAVTAYPGYASSREFSLSPKRELAELTDFEELDSSDKITEMAPETISDDKLVVNSAMVAKSFAESPAEISNRDTRMTALLLRQESIQFLRLLISDIESSQKNVTLFDFIRESLANLHTFSELVTENLISVEGGSIVVTELGDRVLSELAGDASADK